MEITNKNDCFESDICGKLYSLYKNIDKPCDILEQSEVEAVSETLIIHRKKKLPYEICYRLVKFHVFLMKTHKYKI